MKKSKHPATVPEKKTRKFRLNPRILIAAAVVIVLGGGIGFLIARWDYIGPNRGDHKTVATCNDHKILYEELRFITTHYKNQLADSYGETIWDDPITAEKYRPELEKLVWDNLNQNYTVFAACKYLGIKTSGKAVEKYVDQQMDTFKDNFASKKAYKKALREQGMTEDYLRFSFSVMYLESMIHLTLEDYDLYEYRLEDNAADYVKYVLESGEYVRTLHIFIRNEKDEDPAANLLKAQQISDELQALPTLEERRKLLGDYIGSKINDDFQTVTGDGYYFMRGEMVSAYENASFDLKVGEVSEPVVCNGGNFVIMRLDPEPKFVDNHITDLMDAYHGVCLNRYIENFRSECEVVPTEYGMSLDLLDIH